MRWLIGLWLLAAPLAQATDFAPVLPGRALVFPADHGAHPGHRTEWWYVTGWLTDEGGQERGFQLTFFRLRSGIGEGRPGRFSPAQIMLAHAAVADPANGRLLHMERSARASGEIAGASEGRGEVWLGDWSLRPRGADGVLEARVAGERFAYDLRLRPQQPPMANGEGGFSQKGPEERHASYYYSLPQLAVEGSLSLGGRELKVRGQAWLDHEWSSELMPEGAVGWDWIGINLDDGGALMAFRMRDAAGASLWSGGSLRDAQGKLRVLSPAEVCFTPVREWTSPRTGARYPVEVTVRAGEREFRLQPLLDDQELDSRASTGAVYWEGAVRAYSGAASVGRGYLEMTGYSGRLRM